MKKLGLERTRILNEKKKSENPNFSP